MSERFRQLFIGGTHAHGQWDKETGNCKTLKTPATVKDYEAHLAGEVGLGLVPLSTDGTCRFAAIDIDVDNIDHVALYRKVRQRRMPLTVCRSKSGGAHLYLFMAQPMKATAVMPILRKWASALGYPRAEIFPKQAKVDSQTNLGNWLNCPYFSAANTVRYAVGELKNKTEGDVGALELNEFLDSVQLWDGLDSSDSGITADLVQIDQMPPCLAALTRDGLPEGARNSGLFNFAVFYRKSSPNGWEEKLAYHNQHFLNPPLPEPEIRAIIRSISQRKYQYTCHLDPICSVCDRKTCVTLPFGVNHEPWKDSSNYPELLVTHLRKFNTDPPAYILEVNGRDVPLTADQFASFPRFKQRVCERLDLVLAPVKQERWDLLKMELLDRKTDMGAPRNASEEGVIIDKVYEFLALYERSTSREDLLRGLPIEYHDKVAFRVSDLQRWLHSQRMDRVDAQKMYAMLHRESCSYQTIRVKGKTVTVWTIPKDQINIQTEDFTKPEIKALSEDL